MSGNFVSNHTRLHIVPIRQTQMLFGRHITKHRTPIPTNHRSSDRRRNMVVPRCNIRRQRSQRVKGRLMTPLQLLFHIFLNEIHRYVTWPLIHYLHPAFPRPLG